MAAKKSDSRGSAHVTTDHDRIRTWVEERGGHPAVVKRTRGARGPGILRIDFPGYSGEGTLEPMDWDEFLDVFERQGLAFLYQEETGSGRPSRFNKFVHRDVMSFEDAAAGRGAAKKAPRARGVAGARGGKKVRGAVRSARPGTATGSRTRGTATRKKTTRRARSV